MDRELKEITTRLQSTQVEDSDYSTAFDTFLRCLNRKTQPESQPAADESAAIKRQVLQTWTEILTQETLKQSIRAKGFSALGSFVSSEAASLFLISTPGILHTLISAHRFLGSWFRQDSSRETTPIEPVPSDSPDRDTQDPVDSDSISLTLMQLMRNLALHPQGRSILRHEKDYLIGLQKFILDSEISGMEKSDEPARSEKRPCSASQCMAMAIVRIIYTPSEPSERDGEDKAMIDEQIPWDFEKWVPHAALVRMLRMPDGRTLWPNIEAARALCMWSLCPAYVAPLIRAKAFRPIFVFAANNKHPLLLQEAASAARILLERNTQMEMQSQSPSNPLPAEWATPHLIPALASWIQNGNPKDRIFAMQVLNRGLINAQPVFRSAESHRDLVPALKDAITASAPGAQLLLQRLESSPPEPSANAPSVPNTGNTEKK